MSKSFKNLLGKLLTLQVEQHLWQTAYIHPILRIAYKENVEGFRDFKIRAKN
jgi:hypothetical protein